MVTSQQKNIHVYAWEMTLHTLSSYNTTGAAFSVVTELFDVVDNMWSYISGTNENIMPNELCECISQTMGYTMTVNK